MSIRQAGSRFARHLENMAQLSKAGCVGNVCSTRRIVSLHFDSTRFDRNVSLHVDSTSQKSICARLRKYSTTCHPCYWLPRVDVQWDNSTLQETIHDESSEIVNYLHACYWLARADFRRIVKYLDESTRVGCIGNIWRLRRPPLRSKIYIDSLWRRANARNIGLQISYGG